MEDVASLFHEPHILDVKVERRDFGEKKKYPPQEILGFRIFGMRVSWNGKMRNGVEWKCRSKQDVFAQNNLHYLYIGVGKGVSHKSLASTLYSESGVYCNYNYSQELQSFGQF